MQVLDDGTVLIAGAFGLPEDVTQAAEYGFVIVDPVTGEARRTVVALPEAGADSRTGRAAVTADGRTLYIAVHEEGRGIDRHLLAVDVATGGVAAEHDVTADPATAGFPWLDLHGVAPRSDGGVRVLMRAGTQADVEVTVPLVADYGPDLQPLGEPAPLLDEPADNAVLLVPGATDGTVFAVVDQGAGGEVIAVPEGSTTAVPLVRSADIEWLEEQAVEPGQVWLTVPLARGAASIDLTTGEVAEPVDTGCREGQGVRWAQPGGVDSTFLLGECEGKETLWVLGP